MSNRMLRNMAHDLRGWLGYHGAFGKLRPPILIVGSQNSGTTILADALGTHPDVENRSEARVLWDPAFHDRGHDSLKTAEDVTRSDLIRLRGNFCYYQWVSRRQVVLNKHPENAVRIHFLKKIFPESLLIHIVRDGRAAICSNYLSAIKKSSRQRLPFAGYTRPPGWREQLGKPMLEQMAYMWNTVTLYASREGRRYGDGFLEVRYEDLPSQSGMIIERIWRWAGVAVEEKHIRKLPEFENRNHKWRSTLTPEQVRTVEDVAGEGLRYFGYL